MALNRPIDVAAAEAIVSTFIEAVIAPAVDEEARPILAKKAEHARRDCRSSRAALSDAGVDVSSARFSAPCSCRNATASSKRGRPWTPDALPDGVRVVTKRQPTAKEWEALRFAWRICAHVKSNTVIFTDARRTLAIGAGQMSRVDAVNVAVMKARRGRAGGIGRRVGCLLPVPRRPRRRRGRRRDRRRAAGRIDPRRGSDRRRRRARPRDGVHGTPPLPALIPPTIIAKARRRYEGHDRSCTRSRRELRDRRAS